MKTRTLLALSLYLCAGGCLPPPPDAASDERTPSEERDEAVPDRAQGACEQDGANAAAAHRGLGCEYFAVDLDNATVPGGRHGTLDGDGAQFVVVVVNPPDATQPATIEVERFSGDRVDVVMEDALGEALPRGPLQPGEAATLKLARRDVVGTALAPLAYRIATNAPVAAYQFNPLEREVYSGDASQLLPTVQLGREYFAVSYQQTFADLRGYVAVVAVHEGVTTVSVTVTAATRAGLERRDGAEVPIPSMVAGETRQWHLSRFDVLALETDAPGADLSGTHVVSDRDVAVFGGSEAAAAPDTARCIDVDPASGLGVCAADGSSSCRTSLDCLAAGLATCCADHLEEQLFPITNWGSSYIISRSWERGDAKDLYRIFAAEDDTAVTLVPPQAGFTVPVLDAGQHFEFESAADFEVRALGGKPILLAQYLTAPDADAGPSGDASLGDPSLLLPAPVEHYRTELVVLVPGARIDAWLNTYADNYVQITAPLGSLVEVDGVAIAPHDFAPVGSGAYGVLRQRLPSGVHTVASSEPAGVIVYGWDNHISYAYGAGVGLSTSSSESSTAGRTSR